jgi:hypothetical protein
MTTKVSLFVNKFTQRLFQEFHGLPSPVDLNGTLFVSSLLSGLKAADSMSAVTRGLLILLLVVLVAYSMRCGLCSQSSPYESLFGVLL